VPVVRHLAGVQHDPQPQRRLLVVHLRVGQQPHVELVDEAAAEHHLRHAAREQQEAAVAVVLRRGAALAGDARLAERLVHDAPQAGAEPLLHGVAPLPEPLDVDDQNRVVLGLAAHRLTLRPILPRPAHTDARSLATICSHGTGRPVPHMTQNERL
jgi:hypothetical protein